MLKHLRIAVGVFAACVVGASAGNDCLGGDLRVFVGTYTQGTQSKGIYTMTFDPATGALGKPALAAEAENPSFLAKHPRKPLVYAVNEISNYKNENAGAISAFIMDESTGKLALINQESSLGAAPCHLVVDPVGLHLLCANYMGGNMVAKHLRDDGGVGETAQLLTNPNPPGPNKARQEGPHAHCVRIHPNGEWALLADLGTDEVRLLRYSDATGRSTVASDRLRTKPGAGPRHLAYHPTLPIVYVNGELDSTINVFSLDPHSGASALLESHSTLPAGGHEGNSTAETVVHPSGRYVYVSNRGHDSIAMFAIEQTTGKLTPLGQEPTQGKTPRNFNIDPSGNYLIAANQESNSLVVFKIDSTTGKLHPTGHKVDVPGPVCVMFVAQNP